MSEAGKGGCRDGGVGLVEKPWPDLREFWVFIPSLPLTCRVTLGLSFHIMLSYCKEFGVTP